VGPSEHQGQWSSSQLLLFKMLFAHAFQNRFFLGGAFTTQ
jgi:hypothetical protein